jgi:hypothetical protein
MLQHEAMATATLVSTAVAFHSYARAKNIWIPIWKPTGPRTPVPDAGPAFMDGHTANHVWRAFFSRAILPSPWGPLRIS